MRGRSYVDDETASRNHSKHERCGFIRLFNFDSFAGPRIVVHGTEDALIPVSEAARVAQSPPDVRVILEGVGHMPMWEAPEATAEAVIAWTKSLEDDGVTINVIIHRELGWVLRSVDRS